MVSETFAAKTDARAPRPASRAGAFWLRAGGVLAVWIAGVLPGLLGRGGCPMADIFGVPCPGCGMTRATLLLARGEVSASLHMHALALPSLVVSLVLVAATVWTTARRGNPLALWEGRLGRAVCVCFAALQVAVFGFWIARMLGAFGGPVPV